MQCIKVAVNFAGENTLLYYLYDQEYFPLLGIGHIVEVPLGRRFVNGLIIDKNIDITSLNVSFKIDKKVKQHIYQDIQFPLVLIQLFNWTSRYFHFPIGKLIFDSCPYSSAPPKKAIKEKRKEAIPNTIHKKENTKILPLTPKQKIAYESICSSFLKGERYFLLHGVTGSGKTYIYLNLIIQQLNLKKSVLFLLPEINLTPQFENFFKENLNCKIILYHSGVSLKKRQEIWQQLVSSNSPLLVIGARSSVFLPIQNLGLTIIDEEHDQSFKQNSHCRYKIHEVVYKKSTLTSSLILFGSATPSLETFFQCQKTENNYYHLSSRVNNLPMPTIQVIDETAKENKNENILKASSVKAIKDAFAKNEQALVFINKLGYSNTLLCKICGHQFQCRNCSTNLRYFLKKSILSCSYCSYKESIPKSCPSCSCIDLFPLGIGIEKVKKELDILFPHNNIERFDRDDLTNLKEIKKRLEDFEEGKIDLLIGTQILSKGHNFTKVNTVIVLGIDFLFNMADFRANEKLVQLITQISGRSGRFEKKGHVIIQTKNKNDEVFHYIKNNQIKEFITTELKKRNSASFPPYSKMCSFYIQSSTEIKGKEYSNLLYEFIMNISSKHPAQTLNILGPYTGLIEKRKNKYIWGILLISKDLIFLQNMVTTIQKNFKYKKEMIIDFDPINFL